MMTIRQLRDRLTQIIEENEKNPHLAHRNDKLECWVSMQISPRRKVFVPIREVWGGWLTIPLPDNNVDGYKDNPACIELRGVASATVTVKN